MGDIAVRKQWSEYRQAYDTLLGATHTPWAPWTIVPANPKTHRNLMIATLLREVLQNLDLRLPDRGPGTGPFHGRIAQAARIATGACMERRGPWSRYAYAA